MIALPLNKLIPDIKRGNDRLVVICNILDVYAMPFDPDIIYNIFSNYYDIEDVLQTRKERIDNEIFVLYSLNDKVWLPYPKTIDHFIYDCKNVWKFELEFDKMLEINNFELH